ncbi:unnamed protein product [Protopolystoma xenopodis]|uniref:Uncharacterized protein n=1 Tax=Protopolystoma xenopodis TaxID=117903 RepID=A0A448X2U4_9PLAT|nr:unnamed protein product [Protopolystoma xenopodis]
MSIKTQGRPPRYPSEEGLYVGKAPFVAPKNLRCLEQRLVHEAQLEAITDGAFSAILKQPEALEFKHFDLTKNLGAANQQEQIISKIMELVKVITCLYLLHDYSFDVNGDNVYIRLVVGLKKN